MVAGASLDEVWWWEQVGAGPVWYLAPHSDDAAFSSAGLLHAAAVRDVGIHIVTCFSRSGHARGGIGSDPDVVSEVRRGEDERFAASLAGRVTLRWLELEDAPLRPEHRGQHPCKWASMTASDAALGGAIVSALEPELGPSSWVLAPLGLGRHLDHRIVRDAAAKLARSSRARVAWWEDLPYAGRVGLPELERELDATREALGLSLRPVLLRPEGLESIKRAALAHYPSQVVAVHREGVLGHLRRVAGDGGAAERLWVTPAAGGSPRAQ